MTLALKWINANMKKNPWTWGVGTAVIKTSVADLIAQKVIEKRETVDVRRNVVFSLFGFFYLGGFQFYLYNIVFPKLIPGTGARVVLTKLALDQCVHHPLVYFPSFYAIKEIVRGGSAKNAFDNYRAEIKESMFALWKVWVPGMFVCFAFVPAHLRIPYVSGVSFLWTTILSVMQSKFDSNREKRLTKPTIVAATPSVFSSSASLKE